MLTTFVSLVIFLIAVSCATWALFVIAFASWAIKYLVEPPMLKLMASIAVALIVLYYALEIIEPVLRIRLKGG